ncbi:MAG: DUF7529 family protein [Halodesulfurarchaeum sp.]
MPNAGSDGPDAESELAFAETHKSAWQQTLDDAEAMAEQYRSEGWETVLVPTGHTGPEARSHGQTDRFGLVVVIPGNKREAFEAAFERGTFPTYDVKVAESAGRVFYLTELLDPEAGIALLLVGNYRLPDAKGLIRAAEDADRMYTHVRMLDGTHLGSFEHEEWRKFFPRVEAFLEE